MLKWLVPLKPKAAAAELPAEKTAAADPAAFFAAPPPKKAAPEPPSAPRPKEKAKAQKAVWKAEAKATEAAIRRSTFSHCIFELEDKVLGVIDAYFQENGWTVASLIFDGVHVEHRSDANLEEAMRGAEMRVKTELGYSIKLDEKKMSWTSISHGAPTAERSVEAHLKEMAETEEMDVVEDME